MSRPSPVTCSSSIPSMAIRSRFRRLAAPELRAEPNAGPISGGGSMLAKLIAVVVLTMIISTFDMTRSWSIPFFVVALAVVFVIEGVRVVPQQSAWIVERLGKFHEVLQP